MAQLPRTCHDRVYIKLKSTCIHTEQETQQLLSVCCKSSMESQWKGLLARFTSVGAVPVR